MSGVRRRLLSLALAVLLVAMLTGGAQAQASESKVLKWAVSSDLVSETEGTAALKRMVAGFEEENNCTVEMVIIPKNNWSDYLTKLQTLMVSGNGPDVYQVPHEGYQMTDSMGINQSLDAFIEKNPEMWKEYESTTFAALAKSRVVDGKVMALPFSFQNLVLWLNLDLFKEAGVEVPSVDWTWDEFMVAMDKLKVASEGKDWFPIGLPTFMSNYTQWLYKFGTGYFNDDYSEVIIDNAASVELLNYFIGFVKNGYAPIPDPNYDEWQQFCDGYVAMSSCGKWMLKYCDKNKFHNVAAVQVPQKYSDRAQFAIYANEISSTTSEYDLACRFLFYCTSEKFESDWALSDSAIPARKDLVVDWPETWTSFQNADMFATLADDAYPLQNPACFTELANIWNNVFSAAMEGQVTAEEACKDAAEQIRTAQAKYK